MSPAQTARPLPECTGPCGLPVRRDVADANNGMCSSCAREAAALVLFATRREVK